MPSEAAHIGGVECLNGMSRVSMFVVVGRYWDRRAEERRKA